MLDRSGSMAVDKIALARRAVEEAIGRLDARDRFSIVVYDEVIDVVVESTPIIRGRLSPRAHSLVVEWASMHLDELRADWELARSNRPLKRIAPLR